MIVTIILMFLQSSTDLFFEDIVHLLFFIPITTFFSVIDSFFALLYVHLCNVFNEGIVGKNEVFFSHLDALYFSTTTFFTIGFGDIRPIEYSEVTKKN